MFSLLHFVATIYADNPRVRLSKTSSSLNPLENLFLSNNNPLLPQVAAAVRQVPRTKWRKYPKTKAYLLANIPGLRAQVANHLGYPINHRTIAARQELMGIFHELAWSSSTGDLADLGHIKLQERIRWKPQEVPDEDFLMAPFRQGGSFTGLGPVPAIRGSNRDHNAVSGPWQNLQTYSQPEVMRFDTFQTFEYSDDGGNSWITLPNCSFRIRRRVSYNATTHKRSLEVIKTNTGSTPALNVSKVVDL